MKKHSEAIMDVSCPHCNKKFANKYSLASHKSRYHNESQQEAETSTATEQYNNVSADDDIENDEKGSDDEQQKSSEDNESDEDQRSEEELYSSKTKDALATSSDSEANFSTDENENESKTKLLSDVKKKDALASTDSENTPSSEESDSKRKITTKRKLKKQLKIPSKKRKSQDSIKDEATDLLASIESMMFEDKCKKNANHHFDLLESYEIKHSIFSNLIGPVDSKAIFLNEAIFAAELGDDTLTLIKAVRETRSLLEVNMLLDENIDLVKKIITVLKNMSRL